MIKSKSLFLIILFISLFGFSNLHSSEKYSYTSEARSIEALISQFDAKNGEFYNCTKVEVEKLLIEGAKQGLNLFEILYIANAYLAKTNIRIRLKGAFLQELESKISYGNERVYALIPITLIDEVQVGVPKENGQHILDIFFKEAYQKYIEIGTAIYEPHVGFSRLEDNTFYGCFGMSVKKLGLKKQIDRIVMYEKTKIAIYVKAFPIPKRWVFEKIYLK